MILPSPAPHTLWALKTSCEMWLWELFEIKFCHERRQMLCIPSRKPFNCKHNLLPFKTNLSHKLAH